jgi:hypothetical protein
MSVAGQEMFSRLRVNVRSSRREMLGRESGTHPFPTLCPEASIRCKEQRPESRERLRGRGIREREQDSLVPRAPVSLAAEARASARHTWWRCRWSEKGEQHLDASAESKELCTATWGRNTQRGYSPDTEVGNSSRDQPRKLGERGVLTCTVPAPLSATQPCTWFSHSGLWRLIARSRKIHTALQRGAIMIKSALD